MYSIEANLLAKPSSGNSYTALSIGENKLPGTPLRLDLEPFSNARLHKITPLNFNKSMPFRQTLKILFQDSPAHEVALRLTTENNSVARDGVMHDGDRDFTSVSPGEVIRLTINTKKQIFLNWPKECRTVPFNEILLQKLSQKMKETCKNPCKDDYNYGKRLNEIIQHLPTCKNEEEIECRLKTTHNIVSDVLLKPCIKVTYKPQIKRSKLLPENMVLLRLEFVEPLTINVREEYLIYDTVAMISAIGGTLGLFIGISFYNIAGTAMDWLQYRVNWWKSHYKKSQPIFMKTSSIGHANISSLADIEEKLIQKVSTKILNKTGGKFSSLKAEVDDLKKRVEQIDH